MKHRIELTGALELTHAQAEAIDAHSFVNIATVLTVQLQSFELLLDGEHADLADCISRVRSLGRLAGSSRGLLQARVGVAETADRVEQVVSSLLDGQGSAAELEERRHLATTIQQILEILRVRLEELLARSDADEVWQQHDVAVLRENLRTVLLTMARSSRGRWGVSFVASEQAPSDYQVEIDFTSPDGGTITMPGVFQDVLRDLLANARKYTEPGGRLRARLREFPDRLEIEVSDTGRGIPAAELRKVIDFGYRASNAAARLSCGGGFGLTKAYWAVKRFDGQMWIESEVGQGTTVLCRIPRA